MGTSIVEAKRLLGVEARAAEAYGLVESASRRIVAAVRGPGVVGDDQGVTKAEAVLDIELERYVVGGDRRSLMASLDGYESAWVAAGAARGEKTTTSQELKCQACATASQAVYVETSGGRRLCYDCYRRETSAVTQ